VITLAAARCGGDNSATPGSDASDGGRLSGTVTIDGSSTVAPMSKAAADLYREGQPGVNITVGTAGTGGGFEMFCNDETDISDASRPIQDGEKAACADKGIEYVEFTVALDVVSVVVHQDNTWAKCLTVDQLKKVWDAGSTVTNWNQVDPSFPDKPLGPGQLFGPGIDSGRFNYFTDVINGEEGRSRTNYTRSENDNVLVQGVAGESNSMGYFDMRYVQENQGTIKALEIDGGAGCVAPTAQTAQDGTYTPLAAPLFIYVKKASAGKAQVKDFVRYYVENIQAVAEEAGFVALNATQKATLDSQFQRFAGPA
jgi:phosphate transport system substrate-binding protein